MNLEDESKWWVIGVVAGYMCGALIAAPDLAFVGFSLASVLVTFPFAREWNRSRLANLWISSIRRECYRQGRSCPEPVRHGEFLQFQREVGDVTSVLAFSIHDDEITPTALVSQNDKIFSTK